MNETTDVVNKFIGLSNVKIVVECGAHYGEDSLLLASVFPNAYIYSFECNPKTIDIARENVKNESRIAMISKALTDKTGTILFYPINKEKTVTTHEDGNQGASSMFKASGLYPIEKYVQDEVTVEAIALKDYPIEYIDFMWLDAQGAELSILKGLGEKIKDVKIIMTEVEFKYQYAGQPLFKDIDDFLVQNNFVLYKTLRENEWTGDKIYINKCLIT